MWKYVHGCMNIHGSMFIESGIYVNLISGGYLGCQQMLLPQERQERRFNWGEYGTDKKL